MIDGFCVPLAFFKFVFFAIFQGGKDIAEFYEVEEGVLSIGDRERVIVSGDMLIIEETSNESGSSSGKVPTSGTVTFN